IDRNGDVAFHFLICGSGSVFEGKFYDGEGHSFAIASGNPALHDVSPLLGKIPLGNHTGRMPSTFVAKFSDTGSIIERPGDNAIVKGYMEFGFDTPSLVTHLNPWFLYPSALHQGEAAVSRAALCSSNMP